MRFQLITGLSLFAAYSTQPTQSSRPSKDSPISPKISKPEFENFMVDTDSAWILGIKQATPFFGLNEVTANPVKTENPIWNFSGQDITVIVSEGRHKFPKTLLSTPEIFSSSDPHSVTMATKAAKEGRHDVLRALYELDPTLLLQSDPHGWTPATRAAEEGRHEVLRLLYELDPTLLLQMDKGGWTTATLAAKEGQHGVLRVLHELDPTLLSQPDQRGWTPATKAVASGADDVLRLLHELDPTLLSQPDKGGWTPATLAAKEGRHDVLRALYELDPMLLFQTDQNGWTPASTAVIKGQFEALTAMWNLDPLTVLPAVLLSLSIVILTVATRSFLENFLRREPTPIPIPTHVNVHSENRDDKTHNAYLALMAHLSGVNLPSYLIKEVFPDFGLKILNTTDSNQEILDLTQTGRLLYLNILVNKKFIISDECLIKENGTENLNGISVSVEVLPDFWKPRTNENKVLHIMSDSIQYNNQIYPRTDCRISVHTKPQSESLISKAFEDNPKFRWALGFASNMRLSNLLFKPLIFSRATYSDGVVLGRFALPEVHYFCKQSDDPNEVRLREAAFIGGILNGVIPLAENPNGLYRLCEKGQLQYLLSATLQGRFPGVMIDDTTMPGLEGVVPAVSVLVNECCLEAGHLGKFEDKRAFLEFVDTVYIPKNPFLAGDKHSGLKDQFKKSVNDVALLMDDNNDLPMQKTSEGG